MITIFVRGLARATNEENLTELFAQYGRVRGVKVVRDIFSGECKGFATLEMEGHEAREAIGALDGKEFLGKSIYLLLAGLLVGWTAGPTRVDAGIAPLFFGLFKGALAIFLLGVWASNDAETRFGRKDPGCVVIDETAGMLVASAWLPPSVLHLAIAFALFRAADILKPWPCRRLETLPGGWGIMADDIMAGLWAQAAFWAGLYAWETLA